MSDNSHVSSEDTYIVGVVRHTLTGASIVVMSLDGKDVTTVAAFHDKNDAIHAQQETEEALHRLARVMAQNASGESQADGVRRWVAFLREMDARSDAEKKPFTPAQQAALGKGFVRLLAQSGHASDRPDGYARVLIYSPDSLADVEMPRVRLTPMNLLHKRRNK